MGFVVFTLICDWEIHFLSRIPKIMSKLRTLVIDDSAQMREFVTNYILKPQGFEVEQAANGLEGLQKALKYLPDLILTDFEMPTMSGLEFLRELRRHNSQVPVILMTSHGSEQVAVEVFRLGVHDYLTKPFEAQEMQEAITRALTIARLQRDKEALTQQVMQVNEQLRQHIQDLSALYEIGKSIAALVQPDKLLDRIVNAVLVVTHGQECRLVLVDAKTGQVKGQLRKTRSELSNQRDLPATAGGAEFKIGLVDKLEPERLAEKSLSVPLKVGEMVLGQLAIKKRLRGDFTERDVRMLHILADYSSIAIHNMQLLHQLQRSKEEEKQKIRNLFERYVSPLVVEQMLSRTGEIRLGGSRKTISILFADVRGFSSVGSQLSPEILVELLNQYLQIAADAVLAQQGTIDKFMGDAIMAFFNAPIPQDNHPLRALRAAWALHQAVKHLHQCLPSPYRLHFGIGVGVGEAVVGNVGTAKLMNYTAIGDAVNKVKRLQENAKGGQILIGQETYDVVQAWVKARPLGHLLLKGQSHSEPVYEVIEVR